MSQSQSSRPTRATKCPARYGSPDVEAVKRAKTAQEALNTEGEIGSGDEESASDTASSDVAVHDEPYAASDAASGTAPASVLSAAQTPNEGVAASPATSAIQDREERSASVPTSQTDTITVPTSEARAITMLKDLGVEPGALVRLDLDGLNAIYRAIVDERIKAGLPTQGTILQDTGPSAAVEPTAASTASEIAKAGAGSSAAVSLTAFPVDKADALQAFELVKVPRERVDSIPADVLKRIYAMMIYSDKPRNVYVVNNIGVPFDWGLATSFKDVTNILCEKGTSTPLVFWIVGEVTTFYWFNEDGYPAKRVAVSVRPLATDVPSYCGKLLQSLCMPRNSSSVAEGFGPKQVRATKWMTHRGQRGQPSTTAEFTDFFDARTTLKDRSIMEKLSVDQLTEHDIVLMEVQIGRYNAETNTDGRPKRRALNKWQSFFDLQALYLIRNAGPAVERELVSDFMI